MHKHNHTITHKRTHFVLLYYGGSILGIHAILLPNLWRKCEEASKNPNKGAEKRGIRAQQNIQIPYYIRIYGCSDSLSKTGV